MRRSSLFHIRWPAAVTIVVVALLFELKSLIGHSEFIATKAVSAFGLVCYSFVGIITYSKEHTGKKSFWQFMKWYSVLTMNMAVRWWPLFALWIGAALLNKEYSLLAAAVDVFLILVCSWLLYRRCRIKESVPRSDTK